MDRFQGERMQISSARKAQPKSTAVRGAAGRGRDKYKRATVTETIDCVVKLYSGVLCRPAYALCVLFRTAYSVRNSARQSAEHWVFVSALFHFTFNR